MLPPSLLRPGTPVSPEIVMSLNSAERTFFQFLDEVIGDFLQLVLIDRK